MPDIRQICTFWIDEHLFGPRGELDELQDGPVGTFAFEFHVDGEGRLAPRQLAKGSQGVRPVDELHASSVWRVTKISYCYHSCDR